ncbi:MAG: GerMN domain-containing protein [Thermoanaerobaculia bacterium]
MSLRLILAVLGGAIAVAALVVLLVLPRDGAPRSEEDVPEPEETEERTVTFELYFPGPGGRLHPEERELAVSDDPRARARSLVLALLGGPEDPELARPFPPQVGLLELYLVDDTAYVDLGAPELEHPPSGGSLAERTMVFSLVDSLVRNVPEVERVVLLWNGVQRESFSGHLDTSVPLEASEELLDRPARS